LQEFYLINPSKVTYSFKINLDRVVRQGVVDVSPSTGKVFAGEKQKIIVRFSPGVPDIICERLLIEIAHFDPIEFPIFGEGVYVGVSVGLPRDRNRLAFPWREGVPDTPWAEVLEQAKRRLVQGADPSLLPQQMFANSLDFSPPTSSGTTDMSGGSLSQRSARSITSSR